MVSRVSSQDQSDYYSIRDDIRLAETYKNLFTSSPVLQILSDQLGYLVTEEKVEVKQVPDSSLLDIIVSNGDPQHAAEIANQLVDVFIAYNETLQSSRYEFSEHTLQNQITQVEAQISSLEQGIFQTTEKTEELQTEQRAEEDQLRLTDLITQLEQSEAEIIKVEEELELFFPIPLPTTTPVSRWSATATPIPTPTLAPTALVEFKETQNQLDQLQTLRNLYKDAYSNLLVLGSSSEAGNNPNNPANQNRQDQLQTSLLLYQQIYTSLLNNYETVRLARLQNTPNVVLIEPAKVPSAPIQPQPIRSAMLGVMIGIFVMGAVAFLIEYLDDTLKTPEDVQNYLQLPVLGMIGEIPKPAREKKDQHPGAFVAENPLSPISEAFRTLRTNVGFASVKKPVKSLLITSANPSEGKSTLALNLAVVMAQGGKYTLLVDADLRRPVLHRFAGIDNREGLSDLYGSQTQVLSVIHPWGDPPIGIITSGALPPNPAEVLSSQRTDSILNELKKQSDIIILDSSPAIVSDPVTLSAKVDGVLIMVEPGKTKIGSAQVLIEQLQRANANVLGVVMNPISRRYFYYYSRYQYYKSGYGYGYAAEDDE
jgi:capsular exopolysaccharide synthesis family protein